MLAQPRDDAMEVDYVDIEGVHFAAVSERQSVEIVRARLAAGEGGWLCPLNVDTLRRCSHDPGLRRLVNSADVVVADGMPLVWSSRLRGTPLPERVAGSSLILSLPGAVAQDGRSLFLLGGNPGAARGAAEQLQKLSVGLHVAGTLCPPIGFEHDATELARIVAALEGANPDVVFVGLGFPKQDILIDMCRVRLPRTWFVSCGISFSFVTGEVRRAPRWLQITGLEWTHRLLQEPRRLFRRYVVNDVPFALKLLAASIVRRKFASPKMTSVSRP